MDMASTQKKKGDKGVVMEGALADWYAKTTAHDLAGFKSEAARMAERLAPGSRVLEVAPGPGYLAITLAGLGDFQVTGLDISRSFVRMATARAVEAGVKVDFRHGDAAAMPFAEESFDFIVCRAAFKNFADPLGALCEMHSVLAPGGEALIVDMRRDATDAAIADRVAAMRLSPLNSWMTGFIFRHTLRDRAYARGDFERMAAATPFRACRVNEDPLGMEVWLRKEPDPVN
jgi:ubiquinone/menaquinone biosynthesis C-methylase UbiE